MKIIVELNSQQRSMEIALAAKAGFHIQHVTTPLEKKPLDELIDFWKPCGLIVGLNNETCVCDPRLFRNIPTVFRTWNSSVVPPQTHGIVYDSYQTGLLGAKELLILERSHYAYIHPPAEPLWSTDRAAGFVQGLSVNKRTASIFRCRSSGLDYQKALRHFLTALPRPCSVFAANDAVGAETLTCARLLNIAVPDEMAVLGVDNDTSICENTQPPLSSIRPDFSRGRELALRRLISVIHDRDLAPRLISYGPVGVTHRASTRVLSRSDALVAAACEKISAEACSGLRAQDVVKLFPFSRPYAEARFRRATGRSILEEIHAVRLERAKDLLSDRTIRLKAISDFCGFANPNSLRKFFLKQTGQTMSSWRASRT